MFWLRRKKVKFDFGGKSVRPLTYPAPKKALCPANVTTVSKYVPIKYNTAQGAAIINIGRSVESNAHAVEHQGDFDGKRKEVPTEKLPPLPSAQNTAKIRSYTLKIKPIRITKCTKKALIKLARQHPRLRDDFVKEAMWTFITNRNQITEALKKDLSTHVDNMRTVYDVFGTKAELDESIRAKTKEVTELILKGVSHDAIAVANDEIAELQRARSGLVTNYIAPLRGQHAKGKQIVYHIRNRINESLDRLEKLKSFYCEVCRTLGTSIPKEFMSERAVDEATLVNAAFEKGVISAMKMYGAVLRKDGTLDVSIIDLGGEERGEIQEEH